MKASCESKQTSKEPPPRVNPDRVGRGGGQAALRTAATIAPLGMMLFLGACGGGGGRSGGAAATLNAASTMEMALGTFLSGVSQTEQASFVKGQEAFHQTETPEDGVGPVFNGTSCSECHKRGAIGGAGDDLTVSRVTRFGAGAGADYSDLTVFGGPTLQSRSLREFDPDSPVPPETVPPEATHISHRIATPLFGAGLLESIPESELLRNVRKQDSDGISGKPNWIINPETNRREIGRFGWKAQISTLTFFAGDAYLNEMGITTPNFVHDLPPQGNPALLGADTVPDPEDDGEDVINFANFMRLLAPPSRANLMQKDAEPAKRGQRIFTEIRCATCHVPAMKTGPSASAALANREVNCYSDLLLHDMGGQLADGIQQGAATGNEFRTAPLWGLRYRKFYLHDGRAQTIEEAISAHSGEAERPMERFFRLKPNDKSDLMAFLKSL